MPVATPKDPGSEEVEMWISISSLECCLPEVKGGKDKIDPGVDRCLGGIADTRQLGFRYTGSTTTLSLQGRAHRSCWKVHWNGGLVWRGRERSVSWTGSSKLSSLYLETCQPSSTAPGERESPGPAPGQGSWRQIRFSGTEFGPDIGAESVARCVGD